MTEKTAPSVIRIEHVEEAGKVFQDTFNAGDIDGLVSLFEPEAVLVPAPGKVVAGSDALRGNVRWRPGRPGHGSK
jgi:ketosteroid isomerase-like protein